MRGAVKRRLHRLTRRERLFRIFSVLAAPAVFITLLYNLGGLIPNKFKGLEYATILTISSAYGAVFPYYAQKWVFSWIRRRKGLRSYDADIEIAEDEINAIENEKAEEEYEKELKRLASLSEARFRYELISLVRRADNTTKQQAKQLCYIIIFTLVFFCAILKTSGG